MNKNLHRNVIAQKIDKIKQLKDAKIVKKEDLI